MRKLSRRQVVLIGGLTTAVLVVGACDTQMPSPQLSGLAQATAVAPIGGEDWSLITSRQTIKGFADKVSAADGEKVSVFVTTLAKAFDVFIFRLGWYDNGARSADLVDRIRNIPGVIQPSPHVDAVTGLISAANWTPNATVSVSGWRSGLYLLKLVAADGDQNYIPLVVRDDHATHDILFIHSVNTDQAYNGWGGKSLYTINSAGPLTAGGTVAGVKVSFDRPFDRDGSGTTVLSWELNMVRWLEANHVDVAYATDVDVHRDPQFASRVHAVIQAGHSEYWSKEMRDHLEEANRRGKGLGFFTGDTGSWAVRYEDSPLGKNRVLVCYRDAKLDPITSIDPTRTTTHWRDAPLNRPTQEFIGVGSNGLVAQSADWTATGVESAPDLFEGTGFTLGAVVKNLVGYEYDGLWTAGAGKALPVGLTVLGRGKVIPQSPLQPQRQFAVRYDWPAEDTIPLGKLSTKVETLTQGSTWSLFVQVVSGGRSAYLQYETERLTPYHYAVGQSVYAVTSLAPDYSNVGLRPLSLDLAADYRNAFGTSPTDARVVAIVVRGTLALGPLSITVPDGSVYKSTQSVGKSGEKKVWYVADGKGTLGVQTTDSSASASVIMQASLPTDRPPDEADTVIIKRGNSGLVIAAGTIQWSWALDDVGTHMDDKGNETKVDPRIQALTRNMVRILIAGGR